MFKELLAFSIILMGIVEMVNFIEHHGSGVIIEDGNVHALAGAILCVFGVFLLKRRFPA